MMTERADAEKLQCAVAARVRERRKALGLTQEQLAELSGLSANYIAKLEQGWKSPSLETIAHLAGALGTDPAELLVQDRDEYRLADARTLAAALDTLNPADADYFVKLLMGLIQRFREKNRH